MIAPDEIAARLNQAGLSALRAGNHDTAIQSFRAAIDRDARSGSLWRNLATAYRTAKDDGGELHALNAALDIDRRDLMAWIRKAELHQRRRENGDALVAWNGALALSQNLSPVPDGLQTILADAAAFVENASEELRGSVNRALSTIDAPLTQVEVRRTRALVDHALGTRRVFTNNCAGLHYPFLPADEFFDDDHFPWFAAIEAKSATIRAELQALIDQPGDALRPYVRMEKGLPENEWSNLDHSLDWSACFLWEYGVANDVVLKRCPATASALAATPAAIIPNRSPSAFFSLLKPGARIPPHTGVTNTRAIVHLPLIVPPECGFRVGGETRTWVEGRAFAFDDTIEHEAWNNSEQHRALLIFDVWNPHLTANEQDAIKRYYAAADASGYASIVRGN